ncbi:MAG TPA: nitrate reductase associated protein [Caulobacteraceae bacterium]
MSGHAQLFAFENDFVEALECIPMAVRFKLDLCAVKLSLAQWSAFSRDERAALLAAPCAAPDEVAAYRRRLVELVAERAHEAAKPLAAGATVLWEQGERTPPEVRSFARSIDVPPPPDTAWRDLTSLQRFALLKLSRDNHDNVNFVPALREFGLL